jgi:hypothetical protein
MSKGTSAEEMEEIKIMMAILQFCQKQRSKQELEQKFVEGKT